MLEPFDFLENRFIKKCFDNNLENSVEYIGLYNAPTHEIKTNYNKGLGETVLNSNANAFIVLGRDRDAGKASGNGGKGFTGASSIDIIVGHMGPRPIDSLFGEAVLSDKDFKNDAARIYISQMSDVDEYFEIPKIQAQFGSSTVDLEHGAGLSTVGIKADTVRLIARENIKLVTSHKSMLTSTERGTNSGIDIMAGYNLIKVDATLDLQPMVKGNNLVMLLDEMVARIDDVQSMLATFMKTQREINNILSKHTHQSNKAGLPTSTIIGEDSSLENFKLLTEVLPSIIDGFIFNSSISAEYFTPFSKKYINSNWNRVN